MPVNPEARIEVSAFSWVPPFAAGAVRDLRVRWALEEAGKDYRERLHDVRERRDDAYFEEQPFGQVPAYRDDEVQLFESGAIVLHIAQQSRTLLPIDTEGRARGISWIFAALNSIEPSLQELAALDIFYVKEPWAGAKRPLVEKQAKERLSRLADWLGDKPYLEGEFTAGDLMMTTVLRLARHTDLVEQYPALDAYVARCTGRPAFKRALDAQLAPINATNAREGEMA